MTTNNKPTDPLPAGENHPAYLDVPPSAATPKPNSLGEILATLIKEAVDKRADNKTAGIPMLKAENAILQWIDSCAPKKRQEMLNGKFLNHNGHYNLAIRDFQTNIREKLK